MSDSTTVTTNTNTTPNSYYKVQLDCNAMWSLTQQQCNTRLVVLRGKLKGDLVESYAVRARRIAATYARFYLELEDGCDATKKGRFYWMALGAFASKTVACSLEDIRVTSIKTVKEGLGKGNLWLFNDISGWHWYYTKYPSHFEKCLSSRNAANYVKPVQMQMNHLPWKTEALSKIKNMQVSGYIKDGFVLVRQIEVETDSTVRPKKQLQHLLAIADHEQGVILQPLIYDDPDFAKWIVAQRWTPSLIAPDLELVFTHACHTRFASVKSVAPGGMKLERLSDRMDWIKAAAKRFHGLMQNHTAMMEKELLAIAGWVDMPDK